MTIEQADKQKANPNYWKNKTYQINCQTCAPAYQLRLWGFDLKAKARTKGSLSDYLAHQHSFEAWKNIDGSKCSPIYTREWMDNKGYKIMNTERWLEYFDESCRENGVYILTIGWKGGGGHATILQRSSEGLYYIEPQIYNGNVRRSITELAQDGGKNPIPTRGILRVDDKIFDTKFASIFDK